MSEDLDLVTNILERTYPKGQSVEVLRTSTYQETYERIREAEDLEHVTMFYYKHPRDFRIQNLALPEIGMDFIPGPYLGYRLFAFHRLQTYFRLERRAVFLPAFFHLLLLLVFYSKGRTPP